MMRLFKNPKIKNRITALLLGAVFLVSVLLDSSISYALEDAFTTSSYFGLKNPEYWASYSDTLLFNNMNSSQKAFYNNLTTITREFFFNDLDGQVSDITSGGKTTKMTTLHKGAVFNGMTSQEAYSIYIVFANANPQYYFLSAKCAINGNTLIPAIYDEYMMGKDRAIKNDEFRTTLDSWIGSVKNIKGDYDRILEVYHLIARELTYVNTEWDRHQSSATAVFEKKSVCAGYSELFSLILKALGYDCVVITSKGHEWVKVKIGDFWYNADITADDKGDTCDTKLLLKSDKVFNDKNHEPEKVYEGLKVPVSLYSYGEEILPNDKLPVYKLYNKSTGKYFLTVKRSELESLIKSGWEYTAVYLYTPKDGEPVYRLYNENISEHHYTKSLSEKDALISSGWRFEGICWYSDKNKMVPVYRLFNEKLATGRYYYTTDKEERDNLVKNGWKYEGEAWYGIK